MKSLTSNKIIKMLYCGIIVISIYQIAQGQNKHQSVSNQIVRNQPGNNNVDDSQSAIHQGKFDPFGMYVIRGGKYKNKNKIFDEIYNIQLDLTERPKKGKPLSIAGHIQFGEAGRLYCDFSSDDGSVILTNTTLSFSTVESKDTLHGVKHGISFSFDGKFLKNIGALRKMRSPVIEGILIKKVNGKETARETLRFFCTEPS